jgi:thiol:disulfide interchange protein DsbD
MDYIISNVGLIYFEENKLSHDDDSTTVSTPRFMLAMAIFSFALYLVPGMFGAPLKSLSGYLPPMSTQSLDLYTPTLYSQSSSSATSSTIKQAKKYADEFHCPHNIDCFFDYEEGMAYAKQVNKPVLLDFTGKGCENCRKIEMNVWSNPQVLKMLHDDYVVISLYVDARTPLEKELVRTEQYGGKEYDITTVGEHEYVYDAKLRRTYAAVLCIIIARRQTIGKTNNVHRSSKYRILYQVFAGSIEAMKK